MTELSIGLGIFLSLIFTETLGVTAGGVIVPGYLGMYLHDWVRVLSTFIVSFVVFGIVQIASRFLFIYGKRRIAVSLILGFLLGNMTKNYLLLPGIEGDIAVIGNIIPGLIASWMDRQGAMKTVAVILITASIVHLFLMMFGLVVPNV